MVLQDVEEDYFFFCIQDSLIVLENIYDDEGERWFKIIIWGSTNSFFRFEMQRKMRVLMYTDC